MTDQTPSDPDIPLEPLEGWRWLETQPCYRAKRGEGVCYQRGNHEVHVYEIKGEK